MEQTIKLYDNDAYAIEFDGTVLLCEKKEIERQIYYQVILDQTLFFPEEGGQSPDKGTLQNQDVIDVQIKDEVIYHTLNEPMEVGETIHGRIDWNHRFSNMQQHSGEHIFSGIVHKRFGYDNVGFHLSDQIVTMDFNGVISNEEAEEIELAVNEIIAENLHVEATFPDKDALASLEYRSKIDIDGRVRIVTIQGVDACACCAPHVRQTGEIGLFKIMNIQNYKGGVRISMLCGFRALEDYRRKAMMISELSLFFSTNQESVIEMVAKLKGTNQSLKTELIAAKQEYMQEKLKGIPKEQSHVCLFESHMDMQIVRTAVNQLVTRHSGICGIFAGDDKGGYHFVIGSATEDVRTVMSTLRDLLSAKGGGSASMVQGSVQAEKEELLNILRFFF